MTNIALIYLIMPGEIILAYHPQPFTAADTSLSLDVTSLVAPCISFGPNHRALNLT